ncbi:Rossmann-like domain-containing protein [Natrinema salinisoli]|uniref:Rossmann-like domain-containing protein n=1 Tax=Natrinema salinisoli TaxID=2878535 RepID=UPI001CEFD0E5|nr:DUF364 domain-containing protein [Natrinema salinisoli]
MIEPILPAVVDRLRSMSALDGACSERVTIGTAAVMVEASVGPADEDAAGAGTTPEDRRSAGLAHRPSGDAEIRGPLEEPADGVDLDTLLEWATRPRSDSSGEATGGSGDGEAKPSVETALGVAAVNALSAPFVDWEPGDPMALLDPDVDVIATVGLFRPAFRKFADVDVRVIERRDVGTISAPESVRVTTFPPTEASAAMADADVIFVTGSAFVYGGLEAYLEVAPASATVVLIGATASVLPEPAFDAGVDVVAGASVTDRDRVREAVEAGACGTDLHDIGVRKVYAVNDRDIDSLQTRQ